MAPGAGVLAGLCVRGAENRASGMKVLITGGCGFLGQMIAQEILRRERVQGPDGKSHAVDRLVLFDHLLPETRPDWMADPRVTLDAGDIADQETVNGLVDCDDISVFHLASVVSSGGEKDFDLALRVNLDGGRNILEACRARGGTPRVVFTSSLAVYGGTALPGHVDDGTRQTPATTYGMTKAVGELMINDYTRKGYIDGRTVRLPTIFIRPGKPNAAASSFASSVFREPLQGLECILPVADGLEMMVLGYRSAVQGVLALHDADGAEIGADRAVVLPNRTVSVAEMIEAVHRVAAADGIALGPITRVPDAAVEAIVGSWPVAADASRALALGCPADSSIDQVIRDFRDDFLRG